MTPFPNQESLDFMAALGRMPDCGISKWGIFAHFCHESFYFRRRAGVHNFIFLPKPARWNGLTTIGTTKDGKVTGEYVDFTTLDEMLAYYLEYVKNIFPKALSCQNCSHCFAWGLEHWNETGIYPRQLIELLKLLQGEQEVADAFDKYVK